jgi:LuxR family transcriptional activator of conjugal transfer of Ti plasmids
VVLELISPSARTVKWSGAVPEVVRPLLQANRDGRCLTETLQSIVVALGFESFGYLYLAQPLPTKDSKVQAWSTTAPEWVRVYGERGYIEVDPRLTYTVNRATPLVWDRSAFPDSPRLRDFFDTAARFGLRSGIVVAIRDGRLPRVLFALNSSAYRLEGLHLQRLAETLSDVMALATFVHAIFMAETRARDSGGAMHGRTLSARERTCLQFAAKGLNSAQIGASLGISARTVHTHFANILVKLEVSNRQEAVGFAMVHGLIDKA